MVDRVGKRSDREVRLREKSADKSPQQPSKSLEELFKKTAASPSIYWKPLSEEQIKERIELRNKANLRAGIGTEINGTGNLWFRHYLFEIDNP